MGTRSTTRVVCGNVTLVVLYRQFDGYISGHGAELAAFLSTQRLTNGIPLREKPGEGKVWSNGPGCLAAQLVAHFKKGPRRDLHRRARRLGGVQLHGGGRRIHQRHPRQGPRRR